MQSVTYFEIDIPACSLTYGVAPCTAAIGVTGTIKCFNSLGTCQDRPNFTETIVTLRFAVPTDYLPRDIEAWPCIVGVEYTPAIVSTGEDLGQRATVSVKLRDGPHPDVGPGFDKYLSTRPYDPFKLGTLFAKFRIRHPFLQGRACRLIRGIVGQSLASMETRHFLLESFSGPSDGIFTFSGKDTLKQLDGDRSQAPVASTGTLSVATDDSQTNFVLAPGGVGAAEYPATPPDFWINVGGTEILKVTTRAGDNLTVQRGDLRTPRSAHEAGERMQLVYRKAAIGLADLLYDLAVNYAGIPTAYIPLTDWQSETSTFIGNLYTCTIAAPTAVRALFIELIQHGRLLIWWSDVDQLIRLKVLRPLDAVTTEFTEKNIIKGSLTVSDQPDKRLSQMWTNFGINNPTLPVDQENNYLCEQIDINAQSEIDNVTPAIKKFNSRFILSTGRAAAQQLNAILLNGRVRPPRKISFSLYRDLTTPGAEVPVALGEGFTINTPKFQDQTGARVSVPAIVTSLKPLPATIVVTAEEITSGAIPGSPHQVNYDNNKFNVNFRSSYNALYPTPSSGDNVYCFVGAGVSIGSQDKSTPSFEVGSWPAGVNIFIINRGRVQGYGGHGGQGNGATNNGQVGEQGSVAFHTTVAVNLDNSAGKIHGGAGGGGGGGGGGASSGGNAETGRGGGGGGGAGYKPGVGGGNGTGTGRGGDDGKNGTQASGGSGGAGGTGNAGKPDGGGGGGGGNPGANGSGGSNGGGASGGTGGAGGAAGAAVSGTSLATRGIWNQATLTFTPGAGGIGDVQGSQIG